MGGDPPPPKPTAGSVSAAYCNENREVAHFPAMGALPPTALGWKFIQNSLRIIFPDSVATLVPTTYLQVRRDKMRIFSQPLNVLKFA